MSMKRFLYPLDALLRKRRSDWTTVKVEENTAGKVVDRKSKEFGEVKDIVDSAEQMLRDSCSDGKRIDPQQHQLLSRYISQQRTVLKQREQSLSKAREVHEQVAANLAGIGRGIKSLEKHRVGKEAVYQAEQNSLEQKEVDELWLLRQSQRKDAG